MLGKYLSVHGTGLEFVIRRVLLLGVFIACGYAFWIHFETRFASIEARTAVSDKAKALSDDELTNINRVREAFRNTWGIKVLVHVQPREVLIPDLAANTLFVGMAPGFEQGTLVLPPLVKRALPDNLRRNLEMELDVCARTSRAGFCVLQTLETLFAALTTKTEK